jgi:hypothetical protein
MALIAQKVLKIGFTVVALPGNVVPKEAVEENGWQDFVKDDGKGDLGVEGTTTTTRRGAKKTAAAGE